MSERFLSVAEAERLSADIAAELDLVFRGSQETYGEIMGCVWRAIDEATVRPGDAGYCWPGEGQRCEHYIGVQELRYYPEQWEGPMKCTHPDYREGQGCPKEAK